MNPDIIIGLSVIAQAYMHITEANHDHSIIEIQKIANKTDDHEDQKELKWQSHRWHVLDAFAWTLVHCIIALNASEWLLIATGLGWRYILLQLYLNSIRKLPLSHLGTGTIDVLTERIFTARGSVYAKTILGITIIGYAIYKILQGIFCWP